MDGSACVVLVVEDDPNDRTLLRHVFLRAAPQVDLRTVKDASEAEDYLRARGPYADRVLPRIIVLDLKLPRRSGLEFLAWVKEQPAFREIPVIVLSSSQESRDIHRAFELGARSYLVKSVELRELVSFARGVAAYAALLPQTGW
jgi:CheY-like chemotaxis protein